MIFLFCDVVPRCIYCGGMARSNISHFPDDPVDVDTSIKKDQRQKFKQWLRKLQMERKDESKSHHYSALKKQKVKRSLSPSENTALSSEATRAQVVDTGDRKKVLVLEIGSGDSHHGLRAESQLLLSTHPEVGFGRDASFIRINPDGGTVPWQSRNVQQQEEQLNNSVFVKLGALAAFQQLLPLVLSEKK